MNTETDGSRHCEQRHARTELIGAKRSIGFWLLMLLAFGGFCFSLSYFVVNVLVIIGQEPPIAGTYQPLESLYSALKGLSLDYSAVTSGLCTWFFWLIVFNGAKAKGGQLTRVDLEMKAATLPFTDNHVAVWVQLGLIGTLVGFMRIGLKMGSLDSGHPDASAVLNILFESFGTALLSSLAAVVLAYLAGPSVIWAWKKILDVQHGKEDLASAVGTLSERFEESARRAEALTTEVRNLTGNIARLSGSLTPDVIKSCEGLLVAIKDNTSRLCAAIETQTVTLESSIEKATKDTGVGMTNSVEHAIRVFVDESREVGKKIQDISQKGDAGAQMVAREIQVLTAKAVEKSEALSRTVIDQSASTRTALVGESRTVARAMGDVASAVKSLASECGAAGLRYGDDTPRRGVFERARQWWRGSGK